MKVFGRKKRKSKAAEVFESLQRMSQQLSAIQAELLRLHEKMDDTQHVKKNADGEEAMSGAELMGKWIMGENGDGI